MYSIEADFDSMLRNTGGVIAGMLVQGGGRHCKAVCPEGKMPDSEGVEQLTSRPIGVGGARSNRIRPQTCTKEENEDGCGSRSSDA